MGIMLAAALLLLSCAGPEYRAVPDRSYVTASWYGPGFHGKPTASGEIFNMNSKTAAHKFFPFGTRLRVTYLKTGQSTEVVVNDRGPFVRGRDIDLSYAAAQDIGLMKDGTGQVLLEHIGRDNGYIKDIKYTSTSGPYTIQLGSFSVSSNAERLKEALALRYKNVYIMNAEIRGKAYYRVRLGKYEDREVAVAAARGLADEGYSPLVTGFE